MIKSKSPIFILTTILGVLLGGLLLSGAKAPSINAELISIGIDGLAGTGGTPYANSEIGPDAVSAHGQYIAFSSLANNLTNEDVSGGWHIYLRDRTSESTTLLSSPGDTPIYGGTTAGHAAISADGNFIAFQSTSGLLVPSDTNGASDIFVYERSNGSLIRVSVASDGSQAIGCSCAWPDTCNGCEYHLVNTHPSISGNGQYIAFASYSSNFVDGDQPDTLDVFVHDQQTGDTTIISQAADSNLGNGASAEPSINADGSVIVFSSLADNLVAGDSNGQQDVFLWERNGGLSLISQTSTGIQGELPSVDPVISADGNLIAFRSGSTKLVQPDKNGSTWDIFLVNREKEVISNLSSKLASGGSRPAISDDGNYVAFTSGTDDIYLYNVGNGQNQLINSYMQFTALDNDGEVIAVSGYGSLVPVDTNDEKDVYAILLTEDDAPPTDTEVCDDGIDNDGDGLTDCDDKLDCRQALGCKPSSGGGSGSNGGGGKNK